MLWISGDTVLYDGVREVADRLDVDIALLHLGGVRFAVYGAAALHDDRARRGRAVRRWCGRAWPSRSTTRAGSTSGRAARRSSASSATAPPDIAPALPVAADRGRRSTSRLSRARADGYGARVRRLFVTGLGGHLGSELGRRAPARGMGGRGDHGLRASSTSATAPRCSPRSAAARPDVVVHTAYRLDDADRQRRGHARGRRRRGRRRGAAGAHLQRRRLRRHRDAGADRGRRAAARSRPTARPSSRPSACARPTR